MADSLIDANVAPAAERSRAAALPAVRVSWPVLAFVAAIAATLAVQAPVVGHYFFGDDFVPLADISRRTTAGYLKDLFLLQDETPNWRIVTGVVYLVLYRSFGLDALPFMLTNVLVHTATAALLFWFAWRALDDAWAAFLASALFGVNAATVPTVGQVTALNNLLATLFVVLALVLLYEGFERGRLGWWLAASVMAFAAAIASNESSSTVAPVFVLVLLWKGGASWTKPRSWSRPALLAAPYAALAAVALLGFGSCRCTEGADVYVWDSHVVTNIWLYLGRLLYPIGTDLPVNISTAHIVAGSAVLAVCAFALVRGPAVARICGAFLALAIVPYLPIEVWSANRYVYLASVPFSILAAMLVVDASRYAARVVPAGALAIGLVAVGVLGLHSWQSWSQNDEFGDRSQRWEDLATGLQQTYADVPAGAFVYTRGGPVTDFLFQCAVLPDLGQVLWGDVKLFTFLTEGPAQLAVRPGYDVRFLDYREGAFVPVRLRALSSGEAPPAGVSPLPHVAPDATGNLCRADVPVPP